MTVPGAFTDAPLRVAAAAELTHLRGVLAHAGYTAAALHETVQTSGRGPGLDLDAVLARTEGGTAYDTLVRLFALGRTVPVAAATAALAPQALEPLIAAGLCCRETDGVRATGMLLPYQGLLTLRDFGDDLTGRPPAPDVVPPFGVSGACLSYLTVRRPIASALDLGTGSGVLALLAAGHARRVAATDINPRALNFAAFGAALNGFTHLEFRQGSCFAPVTGERFDLIACNPPFVISPETRLQYRDAGARGDDFAAAVIRETPEHLHDEGFASIIFNWHHHDANDWAARPRQWLVGAGCDAWLIRFETEDPANYAARWARDTVAEQGPERARRLAAWLQYYRELGIGAISFGVLILRRRAAAANWFRTDTLAMPEGDCGPQLERIFAAETLLAQPGAEAALLPRRLKLVAAHQLRQRLTVQDGAWVVADAKLSLTQGLPFPCKIDRLVGTLVARCDGNRTLAEAVAEVATQFGLPVERLSADAGRIMARFLRCGYFEVTAGTSR